MTAPFSVAIELHRRGRTDEAIAAYRRLLDRHPDNAGIWSNLGIALRSQANNTAAAACHRRALEIQPGDPGYLGNLGNVLKDLGRFEEAIAAHRAALAANPADPAKLQNLGVALREAGEMEAALKAYDEVCRRQPENAEAHFERSIALLSLGRFEAGWKAFDWRWRTGEIRKPFENVPEWRGEDFAGRTLLVYPEQGFGDTILCSRFLPLVKERGGTVVLMCKPPLRRLLSRLEGVDRIVSPDEDAGTFDLKCPMMDFPGIFDVTADRVPPPIRLHVPDEAKRMARSLIRDDGRFKVGIVWSGSTTFKGNQRRATSLKRFLALAEIPGVQLYSLQKGPLETELRDSGADAVMIDIGGRVEDFAETAAVIDLLDLVIMTDSSVAHLCGTMGRPVWNLLSPVPYWLYGMAGETTPWYPSMRLIRQPERGDWDGVFERVTGELKTAIRMQQTVGHRANPKGQMSFR